jgi:hypothetical protein
MAVLLDGLPVLVDGSVDVAPDAVDLVRAAESAFGQAPVR